MFAAKGAPVVDVPRGQLGKNFGQSKHLVNLLGQFLWLGRKMKGVGGCRLVAVPKGEDCHETP